MKIRRILVLEDEQSIADTIVYAFESDGFTVDHCTTCSDATIALQNGAYDLGIFDVGLPDGNGFDMCKVLRQTSQMPIVFLTARADEIDRVVGLEIGGDDYVTKPFSPRELVARARAILRRSQQTDPSSSPLQDNAHQQDVLIHDVEQRLFMLGKQLLPLTKAEYHLLLTMYKHPGRVYTRDQLLDAISDDLGGAMDRVIDAHIKSIRAKLKAIVTGSEVLIETRRGLGYALRKAS